MNAARTPQVRAVQDIVFREATVIAVGDLVLAEVFQRLAAEREAMVVERAMQRSHIEPMVGEEIAVAAAANYRNLRALPITVRKKIGVAQRRAPHGKPLRHAERAFDPMERRLGPVALAG